jgi:hypothetical protein
VRSLAALGMLDTEALCPAMGRCGGAIRDAVAGDAA